MSTTWDDPQPPLHDLPFNKTKILPQGTIILHTQHKYGYQLRANLALVTPAKLKAKLNNILKVSMYNLDLLGCLIRCQYVKKMSFELVSMSCLQPL
jgi:hypothetical protein